MAKPVTIKIFLPDGSPDRLRMLERVGWVGLALDFPRSDWQLVRSRSEFGRPGVYVLRGPSDSGVDRIYVGEADALMDRLNQHYGGKDFWTRACAFTSKDNSMNKAHVRYLESRLVQIAKESKRSVVENGNVPTAPALSEADRAEVESFLEEMLVIYPLVGITAFEKPSSVGTVDQLTLLLQAKGVHAKGREAPEGFVVEAGSTAVAKEVPSIHPYMAALRTQLIGSNVLVQSGAFLRLTTDWPFGSPSTAAGVLLGRSANGRIEWKDKSGKTLKEIQEAAAGGK